MSLRHCLMLIVLAAGCSNEVPSGSPSPDGVLFAREVYPLLLRDCAFSTCHGAQGRFFRVVGPGRVRLDPLSMPDDPTTLNELLLSYERARDMLAGAATPAESLLLRKPLEASAGGQGHLGADDFGRNLYASQSHPSYLMLARWASSQGVLPSLADLPPPPAEPAP
jgi:hypothetical protein